MGVSYKETRRNKKLCDFLKEEDDDGCLDDNIECD